MSEILTSSKEIEFSLISTWSLRFSKGSMLVVSTSFREIFSSSMLSGSVVFSVTSVSISSKEILLSI